MTDFTKLCSELRAALNQPLPGGRGYQAARDRQIHRLAGLLAAAPLPCQHDWHEGVDDEGQLVEPAYDVCINCGVRR